MEINKGKIFLNTVTWGAVLWLFGYVLGFVFYAFVPKEMIGWWIMPLGIAVALWVLIKKIEREQFTCYIALGVIWTLLAVILDYVFIVKMLNSPDYYKPDVYLYYASTLIFPIIVGWHRFRKTKAGK